MPGQNRDGILASENLEEVADVRTVLDRAVLRDFLVEVVTAKQEVDGAIEIRRDADFLREGIDLLSAPFIGDIGTAVIDVRQECVTQFTIGGDRRQGDRTSVVVHLERGAVVFDFVRWNDVQESVVFEEVSRISDLATDRGNAGSRWAIDQCANLTANLVNFRIVDNRAGAEIGCWFEQKLTTDRIAVAIVLFFIEVDDIGITVAALIVAVDRPCDRLAQRAGEVAFENNRVVVAVNRLDAAAEFELWFAGDNRDHTG